MHLMELENVRYSYGSAQPVLRDVSLTLDAGRLYAILGPSGCGKTTLLSLMGGLDAPDGGTIRFAGENIADTGLAEHRKSHVAFVFQSFNLIDYLTPAENVALITRSSPYPLLEELGLTNEEARRNVLKLSGGQQQRVAIARALATDAPVILADEPTGNLDEDTAAEITGILRSCAHKMEKCVVVVTHSRELARKADCVLRLKKGVVSQEDAAAGGAASRRSPSSRRSRP
ncbi:ABC transporter ATP-binding protein [Eggerthella timonensis]|uniref:ABC transporter ATP-binding protein n=1 Tax=Eggerthella timonensis TaxID=1871008 RepID=UPI000C766569|nr:ABC transporter ATP-binding protein [Eggerthella timonensis]